MKPLIQLEKPSVLFLAVSALACFALMQTANAVLPPPDGGYPNGNTAEGDDALFSLTTGDSNTAIGFNTLFSLTTGGGNTAIGSSALTSLTTGVGNTANGALTLVSNTVGNGNTACGSQALRDNTSDFNTAVGLAALSDNTIGDNNTATGVVALTDNTEGFENTANGRGTLQHNTIGSQNTATGFQALTSNTIGINNTAVGAFALLNNLIGTRNAAFGRGALISTTSGSRNIAVGNFAGSNLITGDDNIDIGNFGVAAESGTIRVGTQGTQAATYIAGISGAGVTGPAVKVNASGQLGSPPSAARFKEEIKSMDKASEAIFALKPVSFRYKKAIDPDGTTQFGLIAEDVEKVNPALVDRGPDGKVYSVRYDAVNAMLLNEFLKEHKTVQELKKEIAALTARVREQDSKIQKVSTQLQMSQPAPQVVHNR